jgi:hypothetical protein
MTMTLTTCDLYFDRFLEWIVERDNLNAKEVIAIVKNPRRWQPDFNEYMAERLKNKDLVCRKCLAKIEKGDYCIKCDLSGGAVNFLQNQFDREGERFLDSRINDNTYLG